MTTKVKTSKDYPTVFQMTQVDKDKFVLLGVMNKKQLQTLHAVFEPLSREWRGQYQALAKSVVEAYELLVQSETQ